MLAAGDAVVVLHVGQRFDQFVSSSDSDSYVECS